MIRPTEPGSVADELGRYLHGLRARALEVGQHGAFHSAMMSVLAHALREGYDDDLAQIDKHADQIAAELKEGVRQAIKAQAAMEMPTQGNA